MNRVKAALLAAAAGVSLVVSACADPVGPASVPEGPAAVAPRALLGLTSPLMTAVEWNTPRAQSRSVSGVIGPRGGQLSIPESDFTITFEPGAIQSPTTVTITSLAGEYVAYDMKPHGIRFSAPVTVSQGLRNTEATYLLYKLKGLRGTYVDNDTPPARDGTFRPTEVLPSVTYLTKTILGLLIPLRQTWELEHFSRYMLASG